jgi:hypothetical protein
MLTGTYQFPTNAFEVEWRRIGVAFDINCRVSRDCYLEKQFFDQLDQSRRIDRLFYMGIEACR